MASPNEHLLLVDRDGRSIAIDQLVEKLRRDQSRTRAQISPVEYRRGRYKVHVLFDWTDRDVGRYLKAHALPYHPLWEQGYLSIGDWHTTRSISQAGDEAGLRFFGLKRECGLHEL